MSGGGASTKSTFPRERSADPSPEEPVKYNSVDPGYFETLGVSVMRGRTFFNFDNEQSKRVVVISREAARRFWGVADPIGDTIHTNESDWEVVGIVDDVLINRIHEEIEPYLYFPFRQRPRSELALMIETAVEPTSLVTSVRAMIEREAPSLYIINMLTLGQLLDYALFNETLYAKLASTIGFFGLMLAAVGIVGVVSCRVARRTHEIGVKRALGATAKKIQREILFGGLMLGAVGAAIGLACCLLLDRLFETLLYEVDPNDPACLAFAGLIVLLATALAAYLPARRAASIDPMEALRHE